MGVWYKIYLQKLWLNQVFPLSNKVPILQLHDVEHMPKSWETNDLLFPLLSYCNNFIKHWGRQCALWFRVIYVFEFVEQKSLSHLLWREKSSCTNTTIQGICLWQLNYISWVISSLSSYHLLRNRRPRAYVICCTLVVILFQWEGRFAP